MTVRTNALATRVLFDNTNRAIGVEYQSGESLYGAHARYTVRAEDDELASLAERLPSSSSPDYGTPFYDIFKRYDNDFYKIDPLLFSPAEVWLTSVSSGRTFHAGQVNAAVLRASFA